ncbi:hypothetical protein Acid345_3934 [Candidatus Koribacter versatilis Ellin345]|uniref:Glycosyl hydrolase, BNR repeat protein n=1 Tax=Koribacter versatilis (strain Ellin345) TaxID=204669 RepID=Q1IJL6_KORVE|nr:sialidase family protein [Candidatus Koribacter versatilis]ABF42934.1 hypothetical protein Acid345_3934 [Candidatus Koribacter versatilis Ellin345]
MRKFFASVWGPAAFLCVFLSVSFAQQASGPDAKHLSPSQREFLEQRSVPGKGIPAGAYAKAVEQARAIRARELAAGTNTSLPAWSPAKPNANDDSANGNGITTGRVTAIAIDPTTSGASLTVYIGTGGGGVWKSTDSGTTWTPLTDTQANLTIGSLAIDPNNHSIIYAGTGELDFAADSYYGGGVLKSTNGGTTWSMVGQSTFGAVEGASFTYNGPARIGAIAVQPSVPSGTPVVLAGTAYGYQDSTHKSESGIWRSTDGGTTWNRVLPDSSTDIPYAFGTSIFWLNNTTAYAAIGNVYGYASVPGGVYKSTDSGATWTPVNGSTGHALPVGTDFGTIVMAPAVSTPGTIYLAAEEVSTGGGLQNLYKTTDGGTTWNPISTPLNAGGTTNDFCGSFCWHSMVIAVDPANANNVVVGGTNGDSLYTDTTGGTTGSSAWKSLNTGTAGFKIPPGIHAFAFIAAGGAFVGGDKGLWKTTTLSAAPPAAKNLNGPTWEELNDPNDPNYYGGYYDAYYTAYNGRRKKAVQAQEFPIGSGMYQVTPTTIKVINMRCQGTPAVFDPNASVAMFVACSPANGGPQVSLTGGDPGTWNPMTTGINLADNSAFYPPILFVPYPGLPTMLYGTTHIYQSTNATDPSAPTWEDLGSAAIAEFGGATTTLDTALAQNGGHQGTVRASTSAITSVTNDTLFAGSNDSSVNYSTNGGVNWAHIRSILPYRPVTRVMADPLDSTKVFAAYAGFSGFGDSVGHVFLCSITSNTCTDVSGNLPNAPVNDLAYDPDFPNTMFAATDVGVFTATTGGTAWSTSGTGLPNVVCKSFTVSEIDRTLQVNTHSRGVWTLNLPPLVLATMTNPAPGSKFSGASANFTWNAGQSATGYSLYVGSTAGAHDIAYVNAGTALTTPVSGLPTNGERLYVTLNTLIYGNWHANSYTYVASGTGAAATMTSPANGSTFSAASATFNWTAGAGITQYSLYIGTTSGAHDIAYINAGAAHTTTFNTLPTNGEKIYIALYSLNGNTWLANYYVYYAPGTGTAATMTSPAPGSTFTGSSATFSWGAGNGISEYSLYVGTTAGAHDIAYVDTGKATSTTVNTLPTNGSKVYVTLYSLNGKTWRKNSYTYTAK